MRRTATSLARVAALRPWPYGPPLRGRAPRGNSGEPATSKVASQAKYGCPGYGPSGVAHL